ncbi:MAG: type 2 isopentenyl-diphosphate Delta-isomerase [Candidatus Syntrophonatronum acetioxidans]|uniref:Isopentenyl-diphosphate delta-isomerase n=1 Tax=Candidatus Syntrophonatronum acetioxidans TaxID=1795816 RepID=A0A424Y9Z5_9FIRM|nr:MAG: type 2 isopentenyl-diphosphate Delta-isomerase [Candidatus Syntrophonatronum acetioxidans]
MPRKTRKYDHLHFSLSSNLRTSDFRDCLLVHQSISGVNFEDIHIATSIAGIPLDIPIFINAMTGGSPETREINKSLASAAGKAGLAMAVGSQMSALLNEDMEESFKVIREENPDGILFANIGAYADLEMAERAVEMIQADALQVHLNIPQELVMKEGDRDFSGYLGNITSLARGLKVPLLVKEVGFGISMETARTLLEAGVRILDVGGRGGTNFLDIEAQRRGIQLEREWVNWGIPTLTSLIEVLHVFKGKGEVIASGGINNSFNLAKSLALGSKAAGVAGMPLKIILEEGEESFLGWTRELLHSLKVIMVMVGASNLEELKKAPLVIRGKTGEWLEARGIDIAYLAQQR